RVLPYSSYLHIRGVHDSSRIPLLFYRVTEMPPRFINPICDMETPETTTVLFECSLMGRPSPIITWFKGDKKIPDDNKKYLHSSDGDNHFLKICRISTQDSGVYTCRAINVVGETVCRAFLKVMSTENLSGQTRGRELTAVSLGSAKVQPQKFDLMVGNMSLEGEQASEIELEFEFENEADESQRAVRLVANTDHEMSEQGEKYVSINFDVFAEPAKDDKVEFKGNSLETKKEKPVFLSQLSPTAVTEGETARFTVTVAGFPKPSVQWFHNGKVIQSSTVYILIEGKEEYTLVITKLTSDYEGEYSCTATNIIGQTTCSTYLEVKKRTHSCLLGAWTLTCWLAMMLLCSCLVGCSLCEDPNTHLVE
uniref:Ig-like domain-containing protein n=1 Tax=Gadus morhua TaxID=8049 RepID=A0A8C5FP96_GADMO